MGKLKEHLSKKIPDWRYNYRQLLDEKGDQVTSTVTINKAYSGMKGVTVSYTHLRAHET